MRKTVLLTGASAGIGAATARLLAHNNYDVAIAYHSDKAGAESVAHDVTQAGGQAYVFQADVGEPDAIDALFEALDAQFPRLDALVNNAGIVDAASTVADLGADRIQRMMAVNVTGAILVARNAVRRMIPQQSGAIVNMSSAAARLGSANQYVDYAASKGATDVFTKGLSDEVAPHGIRVNAIRPGIIETDIHAKGGQPDRAARLGPTCPMGRSGSALEVAQTVLWLLSDQSSYVTGAFIDVSGGR